MANVFLMSFLCHFSLIPEVYEIETESSEPFGEFGSQEQHVFVLGSDHSNGSGMATDLIQKLYTLLLTGDLVVKDEEEAHSEEIAAPENGK